MRSQATKIGFLILLAGLALNSCGRKTSEVGTPRLNVTTPPICTAAVSPCASFQWDPNPASDRVEGYKMYWGRVSKCDPAFTGFTSSEDAGNTTTHTLTNMPGGTWYFVVTAYRLSDNTESGFSNEVTVTYSGTPPTSGVCN